MFYVFDQKMATATLVAMKRKLYVLQHSQSVSLEDGCAFGDEGVVRAVKIIGHHADGLSLSFGLDCLIDAHIPLLLKHFLCHAVCKSGATGELDCELLCLFKQDIWFAQSIKESPLLGFIAF